MMPSYCSACRTALSPGAAFCPACGARIGASPDATGAPPPVQPAAPSPASQPATGRSDHYLGSPQTYRDKWDRKMIPFYAVLFLIGLLYGLWMGGLI